MEIQIIVIFPLRIVGVVVIIFVIIIVVHVIDDNRVQCQGEGCVQETMDSFRVLLPIFCHDILPDYLQRLRCFADV